MDAAVRQIHIHIALNRFLNHFGNDILEAVVVQYLQTLTVNDAALCIHYIVILQYALTDGEVAPFDLALCRFNRLCEHTGFNRLILFYIQARHQRLNPLAAEQPHQIILKREEETAGARIALTSGTAAQLIVDTAGLVPLRTDDKQPAQLAHLFCFRL